MTAILCPTSGKECMSKATAQARAARLRYKAFLPSEASTHAYRCPEWKLHAEAGHYHIGRLTRRRWR